MDCRLLEFLYSNKILNKHQHGFLAKKSTITNLLETVNDWAFSLESNNGIVTAYIDFARAFDSVSHQKLLHKLESYGITGSLLDWIHSFLSNRSHCTRVGNSYSSYLPIQSGVIQGSCLGPLLFLIYINDIVELFTEPIIPKVYADDVKLYTSVRCYTDCCNFQDNLNKLYDWASTWQLSVSFGKCCVINIGKSSGFDNSAMVYKIGDNVLKLSLIHIS